MNDNPNSPQQPPYGQPPSGQPQWNSPGQPQYGQQPYQQPQWNSPAQPPYEQSQYGQPQQQWGQQPPPPPYEQTVYGQPQNAQAPYGAPPNYIQPQPKKSRRWLWITLGIIGGIILLGCVGCGLLLAAGVNIFKTAVEPTVIATSYYQAIKDHDYAKAYSYLATGLTTTQTNEQLTQTVFTTGAQAADTTKGSVSSYTISNQSVNNSTASITMSITRNGTSYDVHLQLRQENGGDWKIISFDNI